MSLLNLLRLSTLVVLTAVSTSVKSEVNLDVSHFIGDFNAANPGLEQAIPFFQRTESSATLNFRVYPLGQARRLYQSPAQTYEYLSCSSGYSNEDPVNVERWGDYILFAMKQECEGGESRYGAFVYVAKVSKPTKSWKFAYQLDGGNELVGANFIPDVNGDGVSDISIVRSKERVDGTMDIVSIVKNTKTGATLSAATLPLAR